MDDKDDMKEDQLLKWKPAENLKWSSIQCS